MLQRHRAGRCRAVLDPGKIGQYLRENEWLMAIKQRTGIPGGVCEFDLPSYHYWLHPLPSNAPAQLAAWTRSRSIPLRDGSAIILRILRESGRPQPSVAPQGMFQQMIGGKTGADAAPAAGAELPACRRSAPTSTCSTSASSPQNGDAAPNSTPTGDVAFELTFCNL